MALARKALREDYKGPVAANDGDPGLMRDDFDQASARKMMKPRRQDRDMAPVGNDNSAINDMLAEEREFLIEDILAGNDKDLKSLAQAISNGVVPSVRLLENMIQAEINREIEYRNGQISKIDQFFNNESGKMKRIYKVSGFGFLFLSLIEIGIIFSHKSEEMAKNIARAAEKVAAQTEAAVGGSTNFLTELVSKVDFELVVAGLSSFALIGSSLLLHIALNYRDRYKLEEGGKKDKDFLGSYFLYGLASVGLAVGLLVADVIPQDMWYATILPLASGWAFHRAVKPTKDIEYAEEQLTNRTLNSVADDVREKQNEVVTALAPNQNVVRGFLHNFPLALENVLKRSNISLTNRSEATPPKTVYEAVRRNGLARSDIYAALSDGQYISPK